MSKYPVPIFQPTVPHDCQSNPLWLEQIQAWMSLQTDRQEAIRRQLETQNHLLLQLNRRLDRVFLQLATLETDSATRPQRPDQTDADERDFNATDESSLRPGPASKARNGVSSWMQQRESMLKCLVAQLEIEDSLYPADIQSPAPTAGTELTSPPGIPTHPSPAAPQPEGLSEIEALKEQLQAAIREMEVECSVQRAKLSHEQARLEAREAELQRREKKLVCDNREQLLAEERAEPLVSRIKGLLRRS